ncbi:MAG TPA: ATP-binding protein [Gaiellaceae bacterium]|jgi:heavy metal sensor kinase|nr:ATP-binding protein [Gaiellaceae bacterium]
MRRVPIRLRVAGAFAVAMAIVLAGTGWFLYMRLDSHLSLALDRGLRLRAQDLAELVREPGSTPLAHANGAPFVEEGEAFAQLLDDQGRVLDATRPLRSQALLSVPELRVALGRPTMSDRRSVPGLDEPARLLATPIRRHGERVVLIVGATRGDVTEALASLRDELLIAGPIALVLASLAGYLLAGVSLRAVESMRRRAAAISAETPGERLPVPQTGDELERLGETLNEMLARLEAAFERERDFVADAGHELRTPLAFLRTELELALRHAQSREELRDAVRASSEEVDRLAQLADDLLLIARSDRGKLRLQLETIDASDLLNSVASRFEWRAQETGRLLRTVTNSPFVMRADRLRIEQALSNLVENALRHGDGAVRLSAASIDGLVEMHVTDEGRGFPPQFLGQAFERFARADGARTGGSSGLGLSIVRVIAEAHGGSAHVANKASGGADAWITLPTSSAAG